MTAIRRLAAILAADVAGYSRLMGADEEGTLARLKALRRGLVDPERRSRNTLAGCCGLCIDPGAMISRSSSQCTSIAEPGDHQNFL
jgi:hypothetical protein